MLNFLKNSMLYTVSTVILKISSFILLPFYTRLLTQTELGNIYLLETAGIILGLLSSVQLKSAISRYYYDFKNDLSKIKVMYSSIVLGTMLISTPIYIILLLFGKQIFVCIDIKFFPYVAMALGISYFNIYYEMILSLLYVEEKARRISILSICVGIGTIVLTIILVIKSSDKLYGYLLSKFISAFIQYIIFVVYSKKYFILKIHNFKEYFSYSFQRVPMFLSSWIVTFADRLMIYGYSGAAENALYSVGYKLGQIPDLVFQSTNRAYVPYVFDKYSNFNDCNRKNVSMMAQYIFTLYIVITFFIIIFSKEIVYILGKNYENSVIIMVVILLSYALNGIKLVFHCPMDYVKSYGKLKSIIWMSAAIINVALNFICIPKYGMYGAVFATFFSYLITLLPVLFFSNKAIKIKYDFKAMLKVLGVSMLYFSLFTLKLSVLNLILKIIASVIYLLVIIKINNLNVKDLKSIINKILRRTQNE
jgi:O-antigen/teichoic acid export membrane protein